MSIKEAPSYDDKVEAIFQFWKFLDVIEFKGGVSNFDPVFHRELADFLIAAQETHHAADRRRLILVARGHLKSTLCTVAYVLWRIYRNPNTRICVATATKAIYA